MTSLLEVEELRDRLREVEAGLLASAGDLAEAVRERTDDPTLFGLAEQVVVALRLAGRLRRFIALELGGS
jgi:hypothetical protein